MTLRELRLQKGFQQSYVAKQLGVSSRHLNRIEKGEGYLTNERADKLAKIYSMKMSEIVSVNGGNNSE